MKIVKKINNNVAVGLDGNGREVIITGRGVGFGEMPYELSDLSRIDRTFYDVEKRYFGLLEEVPPEVFGLVAAWLDEIRPELQGTLNPNLAFVLTDHINFAIERQRKGLIVPLPYSFELEYEHPELTELARRFLERVNEVFGTELAKGEITAVTMHLLHALEGQEKKDTPLDIAAEIERRTKRITEIIEEHYHTTIDRSSFYYFRFRNHLKYFFQRYRKDASFDEKNESLFESVTEQNPEAYRCVQKIDDYLYEDLGERCRKEEMLYLTLHVSQLYNKEDCNRKGITSDRR